MNFLKKLYYLYFAKRIVKKNADYKRDKYEDRNVLEEIIFPYALAEFEPKTILDVGREDYQAFYNDFFKGRELWTIDYDPEHSEFGAGPDRHIVDNILNIKNYFQPNYFDLIIMNGVLGWGLDKEDEAEKAFADLAGILKPGGLLVIGWNDFKDKKMIKPAQIKSLAALSPFTIKPLKGSEFKCVNGEHTYNFYIKPD
jgi:SAM-dependent methyltransferase